MKAAPNMLFAAVLAATSLVAVSARAQCTTDVECKGARVCRAGVCAEPSPPPLVAKGDVAYRTETRGISGLIIAGPIVLGVAYITGIAVTAGLEADSDIIGFSTIPIAGPWVMMADDRTSNYSAALAADGILQAGGVAMFVIGLSVRREHQVPLYASADGSVRVGVSSVPLAGGSLLSASGSF